ncbi:MAG: hypothetical protein KGH72_04440 [Candidatus Micrarchaeota archaeon]|nr:hypothetical protein [Candidatus Micrarchaeota archaeon]
MSDADIYMPKGLTVGQDVRLVVTCMDWRLDRFIDRDLNDGNTIILRDAGGSAGTMENTIKQLSIAYNVTAIVMAGHTDCGAMGLVFKAVREGAVTSPDVEHALVRPFRGQIFETRAELESLNPELQAGRIREYADKIGAHATPMLIDVATLDLPKHDGEKRLIITKPTLTHNSRLQQRDTGEGAEHAHYYFIQANSVSDVLPDIRVAVEAVGVKKILLVAEDREQERQFTNAAIRIKKEPWIGDVPVVLAKARAKVTG